MRTLAVTGGSGFIGDAVARAALAQGMPADNSAVALAYRKSAIGQRFALFGI